MAPSLLARYLNQKRLEQDRFWSLKLVRLGRGNLRYVRFSKAFTKNPMTVYVPLFCFTEDDAVLHKALVYRQTGTGGSSECRYLDGFGERRYQSGPSS